MSKIKPGLVVRSRRSLALTMALQTQISLPQDEPGESRKIEVVAVPDSNNAEEWKEGKFTVRDVDNEDEIM